MKPRNEELFFDDSPDIGSATCIPHVFASCGEGVHHIDIYSYLLTQKKLNIFGKITPATGERIISCLQYLNAVDGDITIYINSPGGCLITAFAIIDAINNSECNINTIAIGQACSAGALILGCGDNRSATKNTRIMIHQLSSGASGTMEEIEDSVKETKKLNQIYLNIMAKSTNKSISEIAEAIKKDNYMSPTQAKRFGIIDSVI